MSMPSAVNAPQPKYDLNGQAYEWEIHVKDVVGDKFPSIVEGLATGKYTESFPDAQLKAQYAKDKHSACMVIKNSLDPSHIESLCNYTKWEKAISSSDPHETREIVREELIEPIKHDMHSKCFNRLTKLTTSPVTNIQEVGREIIRTYNRCKYYNGDQELHESLHAVWWQNLTKQLGHPYQNFVMEEEKKISITTPKNLVTLTENAMKFAKRYGLHNKSAETSLQAETPSAFRADTHNERHGGKQGTTYQSPEGPCDKCGANGHRRNQCQATDLWCNTCSQAGKPTKQCSSHSTEAHRGPKKLLPQVGRDRRGPTPQRKDTERKTTFKTQEASNRQANFLSVMDDSEDEDWDVEPVVFVGGATVDTTAREFLFMKDIGSTSFAPKDGNCLYHALGTATGHTMQEMRNLAATYITDNAQREYKETEMTWEARVCIEYERDMEESLRLMRHGAYGGGLEVEALGYALGRDIAIYEKVSDKQTGEIFGYNLLQGPIPHHGDAAATPIWLLWTRGASEAGNHYDLLLSQGAQLAQKTTASAADCATSSSIRTYASVVRGPTPTPKRTPAIVVTTPTKTPVVVAPTPMRTSTPVVATPSRSPIVAFKATADNNVRTATVKRSAPDTPEPPQPVDNPQRFYLDSGASEHLFDSSVAVTDKSPRTIAVTGISGTIEATTGKHKTFGRVLINPNAKGRNLVSLANLRGTHDVRYDGHHDAFVAERNGKRLVFKSNRKLYTLVEPAMVLHAGTNQNHRIQRALELHGSLHHPSDEVLSRCLDDQTFKHECTSADLKAARELFGPCKACLAGKYTTPPAPPSEPKTWLPGACLEVDILFIASGTGAKIPFLLGVDAGSGAATAREIPDRKTQTLITGLLAIVASFNLHSSQKVIEIKADNETGFQAAIDTLTREGIRLRIMPTERHARRAERTIRELKDYMRCTIAGLNFKLPTSMFRFLLLDTVLTRNVISHHRKSKCPRELLTGHKPNVMEDLRYPFGTVGFTQVSASALISDMFPRAELAVVVGHYVNERGAVMVWLPRSNRVVKRHSIKPVTLDTPTKTILETASSEHVELDFILETTFGSPQSNVVHVLPGPTRADDDNQPSPPVISQDSTIIGPSESVLIPPNTDDASPGTNGASPATPPAIPETPPISPPTTSANPSATEDVHAAGTSSATTPPSPATLTTDPPDPTPTIAPRRSTRDRRPPVRLGGEPSSYQAFQAANAQPLHPDGNLTVRQARNQDPEATQAALEAEIHQMLKLSVIGRRDVAIQDTILPSKMFLKWKTGGLLKARLVIGGHMQDKANLGDTYSPTVNTESVNVILTIASAHKIQPHTIDVSGAFLHVPLQGNPVHMRLSRDISQIVVRLAPEFLPDVQEDGKLVVRIQKAIYGLSESSRQWSDHLAQTLTMTGYTRLHYDRSVYIKFSKTHRPACILCSHVDDILIVDFEGHHRQQLVEALTAAYGPVKQQGGRNLIYLGVNIEATEHGFLLHQRPLLEQLEYRPPKRRSQTPVPLDLLEATYSNTAAQDPDKFRSTLMRLLYVSSKTRFDLMFAVNVLATRQQNCTTRDEEALAQLVQFAKDTKTWSLHIRPPSGSLLLEASADASYACHPDGRGQTGIVCSLGNSPVFARSGKQKLTAKSSTEAELLALNQATDEVLYLRNLLTELGFPQDGPTTILQDNQSAITMALKGELGTKRTKHFTIRHYFVTEHLQARHIALRYHPGKQITADGLTKPLAGPQFQRWAQKLLNLETPSSPDHDTVSSELAGACYTIPEGRIPIQPTVKKSIVKC